MPPERTAALLAALALAALWATTHHTSRGAVALLKTLKQRLPLRTPLLTQNETTSARTSAAENSVDAVWDAAYASGKPPLWDAGRTPRRLTPTAR